MTEYWFEIMSWIGLFLCVGAFFIKQMLLLRVCTVMGAALMTVYYGYMDVAQGAIANVIVIIINLGYLIKDYRPSIASVLLAHQCQEKITP